MTRIPFVNDIVDGLRKLEGVLDTGGGPEIIPQAFLLRKAQHHQDVDFVFYFASLPDEISEDVSAQFADVEIIGRSEPIRSYNATSARSIKLFLQFHAYNNAEKDVKNKIRWLQSLTYPRHIGVLSLPPPVVVLHIGSFMNQPCLVKNVNVSWKSPWTLPTLFPLVAEATLSLETINVSPIDTIQMQNL